jgi:hypothetical protein
MTADHQARARRIGRLIQDRRGSIEPGQFPTRFMVYNDLALYYLAKRLVEHEQDLIEGIGRSGARLDGDREAMLLSEDLLARERHHFRTLTELVWPSPRRNNAHLAV